MFNTNRQPVDSVSYGFQIPDLSIGRSAGNWTLLAAPTFKLSNSVSASLGSRANLRINEWMASPASGDDWIEVFNADLAPVAIGGLYLTDDPSTAGIIKSPVPPLSYLNGRSWALWQADGSADNATVWATANTVLFLPFAGLFATMAIKIIPDRAVAEKAIIRPRYLDDELIQVPSMALERARMEIGYMAELTEGMLAKVRSVLESRDLGELSQQHDRIVVLREAVLNYLQHVGRSEFSDAEADEHARLVAATGEIESMSAALSRELAPLTRTLKEANTTPSKETGELLEKLFQTIQASAHSALRALVEQDERAAQTVVASRDEILELTSAFHRQQAVKLAGSDPDRLLKLRVQLEILDRLRRLYSVAEHMAVSVLPRGVLAGELSA